MPNVLSAILTSFAALALLLLAVLAWLYARNRSHQRRVQENLLAFSSLDLDATALLSPAEVAPSLERLLDRMMRLVKTERAAICIAERWRTVLPSIQRNFSPEFLERLDAEGTGEYLNEMAFRRGGLASFRSFLDPAEPLPLAPAGGFSRLKDLAAEHQIAALTVVSLQTRERNFGTMLLPLASGRALRSSQSRLLLSLAMQIGMTLENYVLMHAAQRRTREYELLTQIGQVVSSRLDQDDVLLAVQQELGRLFDTRNFYLAFLEGEEMRFELDVRDGRVQPKRTRKTMNGISEHIVRTGQPLLIRSEMAKARSRLGLVQPGRSAKCYCGVPVFIGGRAVGVMAMMNYDREFVYEERDVDVLQTAAGQVAVAIENARLFGQEQRRSRHLAFLNNISRTAISSQDSQQMLDEIVSETCRNFGFDHIGIGILAYATKNIEIKAEAGTAARALGRRIPLGVGIAGRVARTGEMVLAQGPGDVPMLGLLPEARSVLCLPIMYGESLLGVLNVESLRDKAFAEQDVLILRTLADLLATALHNAFVFQTLQQQSITDGLTGIKTRRFFMEALTSEWKRASRSGRPFSVVMVDLDKFKDVNDTLGHLEGDLVLARIGRLLEQKCRQSNVVARYGGDEFVILMPETGVEQAQILSERLRLWIATEPMLNERHITGSFGVASFPVHGATVEDIIRVSDAGMYVSKHAGGNRVSTAEEFLEGESAVVQRQLLSAYIEGFLQREHTGPENAEELVGRLRKLRGIHHKQNAEALTDAVLTLSRAVETREVHSAGHGEEVSRCALNIGRELGMSEQELADLAFAGRVHDVGKIVMPEKLLVKAASLSEDEYYLLKLHSSVGAQIAECIPAGPRLSEIIKHHHERFDGSGYPDGLRGEQIPLGARVLALADAYVTMTTERPFAPARTLSEAIAEIESRSGTHFDPALVTVLVRQLKGERAARAR